MKSRGYIRALPPFFSLSSPKEERVGVRSLLFPRSNPLTPALSPLRRGEGVGIPKMLLQVKNLRCSYGSLEVVHGISLHVCAGEIVGLLGANGAGKSSLLKSIIGLLPPRQGDIFIDGRPTQGQPAWRSISNSTVLVPEGKMIFADMTVRENLLIGGYHNPDRNLQLDIVLDRFPRLRERISQLGGTLSGGEQQMLALGRALMSRPKLLLLDEPSLGLAPLMVREVFNAILKMKDLGMTVLLVEQNVTGTLQIADRAYVMETGEIILEGESADLLHNPEVKRAYLGKGAQEVWL